MILLAAVVLAELPPPPSGRPLPFGSVEIVDPIEPAVGRYSDCIRGELERRGAMPIIQRATYRAAAEASIEACAEVRAEAVAEAESALSRAPDYQNAERRAAAIRHAFDGTDFQKRNLLEIMDAVRRERSDDARNQ